MKVSVCVSRDFEIEVNEKVFEDLYKIHSNDASACGSDEQYEEAINIIQEKTGLPWGDSHCRTGYIYGVYNAEDYTPILEF